VTDGSARIRVLAVDDHVLVRQGISVLIGTEPDMTLVAEASNGREAIQQFRAHRPDITIRAVHAGKKALSPEASYEIAEHATDDALTPAEINVLRLIAAGNANKQIADQLSITEETVKGRVKNILSKLGANDRTQAAMIGLKRGIIEL
jgi:DNA-binding NarL/FixJ family response regulator